MANKSAISNYIFNKLSESIETIMETAITGSLTTKTNKEKINEKIMVAIDKLSSQDTDKLLQSAKIPITYSFWTNELRTKEIGTYKAFEDAVKEYQKNTTGGKRKSHKKRKHVKKRKTNKQKGGNDESIDETEEKKLENKALQNIEVEDKESVKKFVSKNYNILSVDKNKTSNEVDVTEEILQACVYIYIVLPKTYIYSDINNFLKTVFESWKRKYYKRFTNNKNQDVKISDIFKSNELRTQVEGKMYYQTKTIEFKNPRDYYITMTKLDDHFEIINSVDKTEKEVTNSEPEFHGIPNPETSTVYTYTINGTEVNDNTPIYEKVTNPSNVPIHNKTLKQLKTFYDNNKSSIEHVVLGENQEYKDRIDAEKTRLQNKYEQEKKAQEAKEAKKAQEQEQLAEITKQVDVRDKQIEKFKEQYSNTALNTVSNEVAPQNSNQIAKVMNFMNPSNDSIANNIVKSIEDSITASVMNKTNLIVDNINNAFNGGKFEKTLKSSIEAYIQEKVFANFNKDNQVGEIMKSNLPNLSEFIKTQKLLFLVEGENKKRIKKYLDEKKSKPASS